MRRNHHEADIDEGDRAMLDFAVAMTRAAWKMTAADTERLCAVGFDDRAVLQIAMIAAYFNYINRIADALGVGKVESAISPPD